MNFLVVTPAPRGAQNGNRITALRWSGILRQFGHHVVISQQYRPGRWDCLVALHAVKSSESIAVFRKQHRDVPIVLSLTGTDLYDPDNLRSAAGRLGISLADRLITLQPAGLEALPIDARKRAVAIHQSARPPRDRPLRMTDGFQVCVLAHLRAVKDPLLAARAARSLPQNSRILVVHFGAALDDELAREAMSETQTNRRYRWLGGMRHAQSLRLLAGSDLLVVSSRSEGGANVVSEAIACGVPVLSTLIDGSIGILGPDYPGYFAVGHVEGLTGLLGRIEQDADYRASLASRVRALKPLVDPARELEAWSSLLKSLSLDGATASRSAPALR